jgi:hypothetical protein
MLWQGKAVEAEEVLRSFSPDQMDELDLVRWGLARVANLHWSMGDAQSADEVLHLLRARVTRRWLKLLVDGVESASLAFKNQLTDAVELSEHVLPDPKAPTVAVAWAAFGGAIALALMGHGDDVTCVANRAHAIATKVDGLLNYLTAFGEVRALTLCGEFDVAAQRSADVVRVTSANDTLAWWMANVLVGSVDFARGHFADTVSRMEPTVAALAAESAASWSFPARLLLAQSYCVLGAVRRGAEAVADVRIRLGRHVAVFEPQVRIAEGWLAAAEGNVSAAIDLALDAARLAKESGQQAIEMLALHDAVRFGDQMCLDRLIEVARATDGRLATMIAAHAEAVRYRDAARIFRAARQFEQIGALLSAADAFAQAAVAFDGEGDRRHTGKAAAAANRLAAACGGVKTPALSLAAAHRPAGEPNL